MAGRFRCCWEEKTTRSNRMKFRLQMLIFSSSLKPGRVKGSWNPIPKLTIVLIWKTPVCLKFGKASHRAVQNLPQRKLWVGAANDVCSQRGIWAIPRVFIWVVRGAMHSGKKWRSALWLNAMYSGKKWPIREFVPHYVLLLNPDYVAARSLCSKNRNVLHIKFISIDKFIDKSIVKYS